MASQARSAAAAGFHNGSVRSWRPLPSTRILIDGRSISSIFSPVSSETRSPAQTAMCNMARSRMPSYGSIEHGLQLIAQKVGHQERIRFLERDRQDTADLLERGRVPIF